MFACVAETARIRERASERESASKSTRVRKSLKVIDVGLGLGRVPAEKIAGVVGLGSGRA